jgi:uncharacterized Zn finger protein
MKQCKLCGGEVVRLGRLGSLIHYRCRNCGMMFNKHVQRRVRKQGGKP